MCASPVLASMLLSPVEGCRLSSIRPDIFCIATDRLYMPSAKRGALRWSFHYSTSPFCCVFCMRLYLHVALRNERG